MNDFDGILTSSQTDTSVSDFSGQNDSVTSSFSESRSLPVSSGDAFLNTNGNQEGTIVGESGGSGSGGGTGGGTGGSGGGTTGGGTTGGTGGIIGSTSGEESGVGSGGTFSSADKYSNRFNSELNLIRPWNHRYRGNREASKFNLMHQRILQIVAYYSSTMKTTSDALDAVEDITYPTTEEIELIVHVREQLRYKEYLYLRDSDKRWFV